MKQKILCLSFLSIFYCACSSYAQTFPIVIQNSPIPAPPSSVVPDLHIRISASASATILTSFRASNRLVASAVTQGGTTPSNGVNSQTTNMWYQVDILGTTGAQTGFVAAGTVFSNPVCAVQYITVGSSAVNIRPSAGNLTSNVTIGGLPAHIYPGQKFAVTSSQVVSGVTWYKIDLPEDAGASYPYNCSQYYGWVSGSTAYVTLSTTGTNALPTPTSLTNTTPTSNGAILNWNMSYYPSNTYFTFYNSNNIQLSSFGGATNPFTPTSYTFSNLTSCTNYNIYVQASLNGCLSGSSNAVNFTTSGTTPGSPTANAATNITASSFTANWGAVTGASNYTIDVSTSSSFSTILPGYNGLSAGNVTSFSVTGLNNATTYYYRVKACCGSSTCSGASNVIPVYTSSSSCSITGAPTANTVIPTNITSSSFLAGWNAVTNATIYSLDVATNSTFTNNLITYNNITGITYSVTGLAPATTYYYRVRACCNSSTCTGNSNVISLTTPNGACNAPTLTNPLTSNQTITSPASASFAVSASGTSLQYQWQVSINGGTNWSNVSNPNPNQYIYTGINTPILSIPTTNTGMSGYMYQCRVTSTCTTSVATSNPKTLTVNAGCTPITTATITPQGGNPLSSGTSSGISPIMHFSVTADGTSDTYQWQIFGPNSTIWSPIPPSSTYSGVATNTLTINNSSGTIAEIPGQSNAWHYRCEVFNPCTPPNNYVFTAYSTLNIVGSPTPSDVINSQNAGTVAEPINIATGSYEYKHTDIKMPALSSSLNFTRHYSTVNNSINGPLGYGWTHNYNIYVVNQADTLWNLHHSDGHTSPFVPLNDGTGNFYSYLGGVYEKLNRNPATKVYTLTFKTGEVFHFDSSGKLLSMVDLNGNTTNLNYLGGNLSSIVAPGGRTITFNYNSEKISNIIFPTNRSISYNYDSNNNLISVTNAAQGNTIFSYNNQHLITRIITPKGDTLLTNNYDSQNRVISQSDAVHNTTNIAYTSPSTGDATITNPDSSTIVMHHDNFFRLTKKTDELGHSKRFGFDFNNNIISDTDENNYVSSYTYDTLGNVLTIAKPANSITQFSYNALSKPLALLDALNHTTGFTYDTNSNITNISIPGGASTHYTWYPNGLLHTSADANHNTTTYTYNIYGDLVMIASPAGNKLFTYDSAGRRKSIINENNDTTYYFYNNNDNLTQITFPRGTSIKDSFDADNNLIYITDRKGVTRHITYDNKSRLVSVPDAKGGAKTFTYDTRDNIKTITDANGNSISYAYDHRKKLIAKITALGTTHYGYDNAGNKVSDTDALGNSLSYIYDSLNRMTSAIDPMGHSAAFTYNPIGQLTAIQDPLGRSTHYSYSDAGLLNTVTDAKGISSSITYDSNGNKKSVIDPNGHQQTFSYNALNRLTKYIDAAGNIDSFYYDGVGNVLTEVKPGNLPFTRTYDALNRLTNVFNNGGVNSTYKYDANDNIDSIINATGSSAFLYDSLNRLSRYIDMFGDTVQYAYDAVGNKKSIQYSGGKIVAYHYNSVNLLDTVRDWQQHATTYTYDALGRLTAMKYPNGTKAVYTFDNASRLASLTDSMAAAVISKSAFIIDSNGNRIVQQVAGPVPFHLGAESYTNNYSPDDGLLGDGTNSYANDARGNRTGQTGVAGTTAFTFTPDNILTAINSPSLTANYAYDAAGNRVKKTQAGIYKRYVLDLASGLSQVLQEMDSSGNVRANYVYGLDLISRIDTLGKTLYYHYDAQHNTVALSNDTGFVTDIYIYLPFGKMWKHTGNTQQPYTFLGQYGVWQETPTLYYIRARYYDASTPVGRFLSKDTYHPSLINPQTLNRYVYGLNNPVSNIDPTGLMSWDDIKSGVSNSISDLGAGAKQAWNSVSNAVVDVSKDVAVGAKTAWNSYTNYVDNLTTHVGATEIDGILLAGHGAQGLLSYYDAAVTGYAASYIGLANPELAAYVGAIATSDVISGTEEMNEASKYSAPLIGNLGLGLANDKRYFGPSAGIFDSEFATPLGQEILEKNEEFSNANLIVKILRGDIDPSDFPDILEFYNNSNSCK